MKRYIGNKAFYRMVLAIAVPIMIQNGITNFVGMLDNVMVGQIGTEQMSGISIVNQLMFVFNLTIFGAISGPGIFGAQFYGNDDQEGLRYTFRFKLMICSVISVIGIIVFIVAGPQLISYYLQQESEQISIEETLRYGKEYLNVMIWGMIPFAINQYYTSTLRETGQTIVPMVSGIVAVFVNLVFNSILIFGLLGAPKLGVVGAAIATVLSRLVECAITIGWTHLHVHRLPFIKGAYQSLYIPRHLVWQIIKKGSPLLVNEALWASGMAMMTQRYSVRGPEVIGALNISSTIYNVFNIAFIAIGSSIAIIVGQQLGSGEMAKAKDTAGKMIFFTVTASACIAIFMIAIGPVFPRIYNTEEDVKYLATRFIMISGAFMPLNAFTHASYFTLRSGGKTIVTFLFDSVFVWTVCVTTAFLLTEYTTLNILAVYALCQAIELIKCTIGFVLVKKGIWLNNIVASKAA